MLLKKLIRKYVQEFFMNLLNAFMYSGYLSSVYNIDWLLQPQGLDSNPGGHRSFFSKKLYPHCYVLNGPRNGIESGCLELSSQRD